MKQKITLEERKKLQLEMLIEIDAFCKKENIRYMLAFGTLLGAVRHKGFIPWDDDVDISMPLEDMIRFKKEFKSENLKYCDVDTEKGYEYHFSRISHRKTYNKIGISTNNYGVNIDLYPLISMSSSDTEIEVILEKASILFRKRFRFIRWLHIIKRFLPIKTIPGFEKRIKNYRDFWFNLSDKNNITRFHCLAGAIRLFDKHTFDFNPFDNLVELEFEGLKFFGPAKYHEYLTTRYGDYMQLPPEKDRHPYHNGNYYWK